ncbi:hypothetical protein GQ43DRAFT_236843 [Delitschia confertaspora ATCC 74209]|uniref:C2H2-type domain-containing protein n=1 Tax=Delitschia confertaspora ATCC 74209 TaxID=1513339 RepID=A0A9P4JQF5_9PLEO|nr:hypothetical protein GQ43DRAFT_236843 [Delitschia confertaspora ATCC 74209]
MLSQRRCDPYHSTVPSGSGSDFHTTWSGPAILPFVAAPNLTPSVPELAQPLLGPTGIIRPVGLRSACDTISTPISENDGSTAVKTYFFCTFCHENGISKGFKEKSDWKRHESNFHETGVEFRCPAEGCSKVFPRDKDFARHVAAAHTKGVPSNMEIYLPEKLAYGCGFCGKAISKRPGTTRTTVTWDERCNHVALCREDGVQWSFTNTILGLLKQPLIRKHWKNVRSYWCGKFGIDYHSVLRWHLQTSHFLRQRLECSDFGTGPELDHFLEDTFMLGILDPNGNRRFSLQELQPGFAPSPVGNTQQNTPAWTYGLQFGHGYSLYDY